MPRPCTICTHAKRNAINNALRLGKKFRQIATQYGVSLGSLSRHSQRCLTGRRTERSVRDSEPPAETERPERMDNPIEEPLNDIRPWWELADNAMAKKYGMPMDNPTEEQVKDACGVGDVVDRRIAEEYVRRIDESARREYDRHGIPIDDPLFVLKEALPHVRRAVILAGKDTETQAEIVRRLNQVVQDAFDEANMGL